MRGKIKRLKGMHFVTIKKVCFSEIEKLVFTDTKKILFTDTEKIVFTDIEKKRILKELKFLSSILQACHASWEISFFR